MSFIRIVFKKQFGAFVCWHYRRITETFSTSARDFVFVKLQSVPRSYDWPSAIENNGAVGESRYKGNQTQLGPRSLSYSKCPAAKTATADNIVPECLGHFQTHRTMLLAYINANFVRDKVTLVYMLIRLTRVATGEERLCHFETHFNVRLGRVRGWFLSLTLGICLLANYRMF